jgi:hypothetical protein
MTGAVLAILVVLSGKPAPRPTTAAEVLKGCSVYGPAFGLDRFVKCPNFAVEVYPPTPASTEKVLLSEQVRLNSGGPDGREILTTYDVKVAGKPRKAFRYVKKKFDGSSDVGLVTTVPAGPGAIRLVHCFKGMETGCGDLFELLIKALPEATTPVPPGPPELGGRALSVGPGCTRRGPSQLACPGAELTWSALYPGAPETLDEVDAIMRRATQPLGEVQAADKFCRLESAEAMCRVATITARNRAQTKSYLVYGFASLGGSRVWISCSTRADPDKGLPSPCDQVMAFKAPE